MLLLAAAAPARAEAQTVSPEAADSAFAERTAVLPDGSRRVSGRVVTPVDSVTRGVSGRWVTLHRVGPDAAGPLDSARTGPDGGFAFTYRPRGAADAIYFLSTQYGGVGYFSAPLRDAVVRGDAAEITVFDTTSTPVAITVRGRHVALGRADARGVRDVLDVYELSNDGVRTAVPGGTANDGVWSAALPAGATGFRVRESADLPADGVTASDGRAVLRVPFAPGIKQVAYSYRVAPGELPLRVPVEAPTTVLEVLMEDPGGTAVGPGLAQVAPVALEGHTFHRFLAQDVAAGARVVVDVPTAPSAAWPRWAVPVLLVAVGGAMTLGLLVAYRRRRSRVVAPRAEVLARAPASTPDRLLAELAALDDAHSARANGEVPPSEEEERSYTEARASLKRELAERMGAGAA